MGLEMKRWLTNSQFQLREARALRQSPSHCLQALVGEHAQRQTQLTPRSSADILLLAPQRTQRITGSGFQISFRLDWQIDNGFFKRPIMARTQILVHKWRPKGVSQTDLTRIECRLWRRLTTVLTFTMRPSIKCCPSLSSGLAEMINEYSCALGNICHSETQCTRMIYLICFQRFLMWYISLEWYLLHCIVFCRMIIQYVA